MLTLPLSVTEAAVLPAVFVPPPPLLTLLTADDEEVYDAPLLTPEDVEDVEEDEEWVGLSTTIATG